MVTPDEARVVKVDLEVTDAERVVEEVVDGMDDADPEDVAEGVFDVTVVDDLVVLDFVDDVMLGVETRIELEGPVLVMSKVAVRVLTAQDLILVLLEAGVEDDGVALEDSHGLA